jgi:death on curing protein
VSDEPRWVSRLVADAIQHDLISTHGGLPGLRDEGLLEAALARPRQLWSYSASIDTPSLAAAYAYGIARNHPYNDGNKRIAFMVATVFAELNGHRLDAPESEVVDVMLKLAAGAVEEEALAEWLRNRLAALGEGDSR